MFTLATPWLLLLLPLPWLIRWLLPAARSQDAQALKVPFFTGLTQFSGRHGRRYGYRATAHKWLAYTIWGLLVFAASGPQWLGDIIVVPRSGRDIMLAMDISGSMQLPDMEINGQETNRLEAVKAVGRQFIRQREGDRLGLILFGSKAYLQTPLTFDRQTVENMLNDASIGLAGTQTAMGDAIGLGIKRLLDRPENSRVLIVLTDGANNSGMAAPLDAANIAAEHGIKIYTIGVGSDQLAIPGIFGPQIVNPSSDLDEQMLQQVAGVTGGRYFRAKDVRELQQVYQLLNQLEPVTSDETLLRPIQPLYFWPLGLALLISLWLAGRHYRWPQKKVTLTAEDNAA